MIKGRLNKNVDNQESDLLGRVIKIYKENISQIDTSKEEVQNTEYDIYREYFARVCSMLLNVTPMPVINADTLDKLNTEVSPLYKQYLGDTVEGHYKPIREHKLLELLEEFAEFEIEQEYINKNNLSDKLSHVRTLKGVSGTVKEYPLSGYVNYLLCFTNELDLFKLLPKLKQPLPPPESPTLPPPPPPSLESPALPPPPPPSLESLASPPPPPPPSIETPKPPPPPPPPSVQEPPSPPPPPPPSVQTPTPPPPPPPPSVQEPPSPPPPPPPSVEEPPSPPPPPPPSVQEPPSPPPPPPPSVQTPKSPPGPPPGTPSISCPPNQEYRESKPGRGDFACRPKIKDLITRSEGVLHRGLATAGISGTSTGVGSSSRTLSMGHQGKILEKKRGGTKRKSRK